MSKFGSRKAASRVTQYNYERALTPRAESVVLEKILIYCENELELEGQTHRDRVETDCNINSSTGTIPIVCRKNNADNQKRISDTQRKVAARSTAKCILIIMRKSC